MLLRLTPVMNTTLPLNKYGLFTFGVCVCICVHVCVVIVMAVGEVSTVSMNTLLCYVCLNSFACLNEDITALL